MCGLGKERTDETVYDSSVTNMRQAQHNVERGKAKTVFNTINQIESD